MVALNHDDDLPRIATALIQEGIGLFDLGRDVFDLRAHYRERVAAERARRTAVDAMSLQTPVGRAGRAVRPDREGPA